MRQIAATWQFLAEDTRLAWCALAAKMPGASPLLSGPAGYRLFVSVNSLRDALKLPFVDAPLAVPDIPSSLPLLSLTASGQANAASQHANAFTLTVHSDAPYSGPVQVWAAPPRLSDAPPASDHAYKSLGILPDLALQTASLSALWATGYYPARAGKCLWLRFVPLSQSGFRGLPQAASARVALRP